MLPAKVTRSCPENHENKPRKNKEVEFVLLRFIVDGNAIIPFVGYGGLEMRARQRGDVDGSFGYISAERSRLGNWEFTCKSMSDYNYI